MDTNQAGGGNGYAPESWRTLCELDRTLNVKHEQDKDGLLSSGGNAFVASREVRGNTGLDSCFDVFLDAAKELDRRGEEASDKSGNLQCNAEDEMAEKERKRLEATRAKNRRAQKRFREKTKMNMKKLEEDVRNGLKEIEFLKQQNKKLCQDRLVLSYSHMLRKELVVTHCDKNKVWKFRLPDGLLGNSGTEVDLPPLSVCVSTVLEEMKKTKTSLQESIELGGESYKNILSEMLAKFWYVAGVDAMKFGELLQLGTTCEFTTRAAWIAIMSRVSNIDRKLMHRIYRGLKQGHEKLSEYLSSTLSQIEAPSPNCGSDMMVPITKASIQLSKLNHVSLELFAQYCEAYIHLEHCISMYDFAYIWAESPTLIPDMLSLLNAVLL